MEFIQAGRVCPECGKNILFDVDEAPNKGSGVILVSFYCENDLCEFYSAGYIDVVEEILNQGGVLW